MTEFNSAAAKFSRETPHETDDDAEGLDIDDSGATVEDDHPRDSGLSEEAKAQAEAYKESRPDPRDAENVPDHECDDPDAPWM